MFEIGSITKPFTALLLEKLVDSSILSLDDSLLNFFPNILSIKDITLRHLANHTSGLPRLPDNIKPKDITNPYQEYTKEDLENFLQSYKPDKNHGDTFEYSNFGYATLGYILTQTTNDSYENLIKKYILDPLGMKQTYIDIPQSESGFLAQGYTTNQQENSLWNQGIFASAGGIVSNIQDMELFLKWNMTRPQSSFVWMKQGETLWHNGMTGGYASFMAFDKEKNVGLVLLANTAISLDPLAKEILEYLK